MSTHVRARSALAAACFAAFGLAGCSTPHGYFVKEWSRPIREMQVKPIYPPKEDVAVGDVIADPYPNLADENAALDAATFLEIGPVLFSVPVIDAIQAHYNARPSFPKTAAKDSNGEFPESAVATGWVYVGGQRVRLNHVAFPEISFTDITQGNLEALVPIQAVNVALGGAFGEFHSVSMKLRAAESYGLPAANALAALNTALGNAANKTALMAVWAPNKAVLLITEVYTVRDIEIAATFKKSFGASIGLPGYGGSASGLDPTAKLDDRMKQLNDYNNKLKDLSTPGGAVRITSVSDRAITMQRTFQRPIVVGVRYARLWRDAAGAVYFDDRGFKAIDVAQQPGSGATPAGAPMPVLKK
jgi:hypothetical protein